MIPLDVTVRVRYTLTFKNAVRFAAPIFPELFSTILPKEGNEGHTSCCTPYNIDVAQQLATSLSES